MASHLLCMLVELAQIGSQPRRQRIILQVVGGMHVHRLTPIAELTGSYLQMMNKYTTGYNNTDLLARATDEAGNLNAVARRTGISRRRLGKIKAGSTMLPTEMRVLQLLAQRKLP
jgi:hypothetical protein